MHYSDITLERLLSHFFVVTMVTVKIPELHLIVVKYYAHFAELKSLYDMPKKTEQ